MTKSSDSGWVDCSARISAESSAANGSGVRQRPKMASEEASGSFSTRAEFVTMALPALFVAKEPSVYTVVGCRGKAPFFSEKRFRNSKGAAGVDKVSV